MRLDMRLTEFDRLLRETLALDTAASQDSALNGLQVANSRGEVARVACAVDACLESIRRAVEWKADLLFVHHGLFWGKPLALTGFQYRRVRELCAADCALYAVHLPLDAHPTLGNNACLARQLGLREVEPFGEHRGLKIGCRGVLPEPLSLERAAGLCCGAHPPLGLLPFGPAAIRTVGIVSGGASQDALQAIDQGLDLFVSGEPSHSIYHACLEAGINALFGGHYLTEVWGVKSVGEWLAGQHGLATCFLDIPTGL
jgi:dinuclear metal center YbgI/SA1388 family protein